MSQRQDKASGEPEIPEQEYAETGQTPAQASLIGQVLAVDGESRYPLAGVSVRLHLPPTEKLLQTTETDVDGWYRFSLSPGEYFTATDYSLEQAEDTFVLTYGSQLVRIPEGQAEYRAEDILYRKEPAAAANTGYLRVQVRCRTAGAMLLTLKDVEVSISGASFKSTLPTNDLGQAYVELYPGEYSVSVPSTLQVGPDSSPARLETPQARTVTVEHGKETAADVFYRLVEPPVIRGQVVLADGRRTYPLEGVEVLLKAAGGDTVVDKTRTDAAGRYKLAPRPGDYEVEVAGEFDDEDDILVLETGTKREPARTESGKPDVEVPVFRYLKPEKERAAYGVLQVITWVDKAGLGKRAEGRSRLADVAFEISAAGRTRAFHTNDQGEITIPLPEGRYDLRFERQGPQGGYRKRPEIITAEWVKGVEVKADETTRVETDYAAENGVAPEAPPSRILGKVAFALSVREAAARSVPVEGLEVGLFDAEGDEVDTAYVDADGAFEFSKGIAPGTYQIRLPEEFDTSAIKAINVPRLRLADRKLQTIDVSVDFEGDEPFVGPILYLPRAAGIEGTVTPRVEGIPVALINANTQEKLTTTTDAQGFYHFDQPVPGVYSLRLEDYIRNKGLRLKTPPSASFQAGPGKLIRKDFEYVKVGGQIHGFVFLNLDASGIRSAANPAIPGVEVELSDEDGDTVEVVKTGPNGEFFLTDLEPGKYLLEFKRLVPDTLKRFDENFELESPPTQIIEVRVNESAEAAPVSYTLEKHQIVGRILFRDSRRPVAGITVVLFDEGGKERDRVLTDKDGRYRFHNVKGRFFVRLPEQPSGSQLVSPNTIEAIVNSMFDAGDSFYADEPVVPGPTGGPVPFPGTLQDAVLDIASYMPTSQEVTGPTGTTTQARLTAATGDLQALVNNAMVHVLGRKGSTSDGRAFKASLDRAFTFKESNGKSTLEWTPRTYAVETELGGRISGAQASLYYLAKSSLDNVIPLLEGINPLLPDADPELTAAARKIVRTEFSELVMALGAEGGPILQRVDDLFLAVDRALDRMRDEFGLTANQVNTVEEESNLTNFLVVRDYVSSLRTTWNAQRDQIAGFLGTKLVLLSRALSSVVESVSEAEDAMDSVFLGRAERQTIRIAFPAQITINGRPEPILLDALGNPAPARPMLVGELLGWISRFASEEGPTLIRDGGRVGVATIEPTAERLRRLVLGAIDASVPHVGFTRNRVRRALSELAGQLAYVAVLARELDGTAGSPRRLAATN